MMATALPATAHVTTGHVNVLGVSLEVLHIEGSAVLAPIVFLHEGLGSVAMWRDFPQRVCAATGRAGWAVSRRGYGQSAPALLPLPVDYMHIEARDVLPALLAACNIQKPVLLGHSDGGSIALLYASQFETTACIAMAPHVFVESVSLQSIAAARDAYETGNLRAKLAKFHSDVDNAFWQWCEVWLCDAFAGFDITEQCSRITCPLLAIQGHDDAYGTMAQIDALSKKGEVRQLLKLQQCGHSPHKDQTDAVLASVIQFLKTVG
jgi:pimeloyl-ACP methyl ester carboxylesterase